MNLRRVLRLSRWAVAITVRIATPATATRFDSMEKEVLGE